MTFLINKLALFTSLFGLAVVTPPPELAFADDEKIFPGAVCHKKATTAERLVYAGASVVNIARERAGVDRTAHVFCPLVRDRTLKRWKRITVRVSDNSSTGAVRCSATNYGLNGIEAESIKRDSGDAFVGHVTLSFPRPPENNAGLARPFSVFCTLPANTDFGNCSEVSALRCGWSAVHSIRLVEE